MVSSRVRVRGRSSVIERSCRCLSCVQRRCSAKRDPYPCWEAILRSLIEIYVPSFSNIQIVKQHVEPFGSGLWRSEKDSNLQVQDSHSRLRSDRPERALIIKVVPSEGLEPPTLRSKRSMISISPQGHMVDSEGLEPSTSTLPASCSPIELEAHLRLSPFKMLNLHNRETASLVLQPVSRFP